MPELEAPVRVVFSIAAPKKAEEQGIEVELGEKIKILSRMYPGYHIPILNAESQRAAAAAFGNALSHYFPDIANAPTLNKTIEAVGSESVDVPFVVNVNGAEWRDDPSILIPDAKS